MKPEDFADEIGLAYSYLDHRKIAKTPVKSLAERLLQAFRGNWYTSATDDSRVSVNTIYSLVNLILPNLIFTPPKIRVRPKNDKFFKKTGKDQHTAYDNVKAAEVMESALNYTMDRIGAWPAIQQCIQDALFWPFGIAKVGFTASITPDDDMTITDQSPFVGRVSPPMFGYHPLGTHPDSSPMLVHQLFRHKNWFKNDKRFKKVKEATPAIPDHIREQNSVFPRNSGVGLEGSKITQQFIPVFEVHDQIDSRIITMLGENKVVSRVQNTPDYFDGSQFVRLRFTGDNDDMLGIPMMAMVEDLARMMNTIISIMKRHVHQFPGVVDVQEGAADHNAIQRQKHVVQGAILSWNNLDAVRRHSPTQMGSDYFDLIQLMQLMIDRVLGIQDFGGPSASKRKTAAEVVTEEARSSIRREFLLQQVRTFIIEVSERVAAVIQEEFDDKQVIPITGSPSPRFVEFNKGDVQGDLVYDVDVDDLRTINEVSFQQLINSLNVMASHEPLHPVLAELDPKKTANSMMKYLQISPGEIMRTDSATRVFLTAEKENELVASGGDLPEPKIEEDHVNHLEVHSQFDAKNEEQRIEMARHVRFHIAMHQTKNPPVQRGTPQQGTRGNQPTPQEAGPEAATRRDLFSAVGGGE